MVWQASRFDGGKHHRLPAEAAVAGRLIAARVGRGKAKQWLYLFTTLPGPAEEIVALYGGRLKRPFNELSCVSCFCERIIQSCILVHFPDKLRCQRPELCTTDRRQRHAKRCACSS